MTLRIFSLMITILIATNCKQPEVSRFSNADYKHGAYGEIPLLPDNLVIEDDQFYPVLSSSGSMQIAVTIKSTQLKVGDKAGIDKFCPIAQNQEISVVAIIKTKQKTKLVIAQISNPCVPKGASAADPNVEKVFEGYVPFEDIEFKNRVFSEKSVEELSQKEIDGIKVENIGEYKPISPAEILEGGDKAAIKELIRDSYDDPTIQLGQGIKGCIAVDQATSTNGALAPGCAGSAEITGSNVTLANTNPLVNCAVVGDSFRKANNTKVQVQIFGFAEKWKISAHKGAPLSGEVTHTTGIFMPAKEFTANPGVTILPMDNLIIPSDWRGTEAYLFVEGLDKDGKLSGDACIHRFSIASPIALDLSLSQKGVRTTNQSDKKVKFDLNADGIKEETGWLYPYMGLLALDWNGNGLIDNGRELFGNYSYHPNEEQYDHGYQALARLDHDGNKRIDAKDPLFSRLRVWVDENSDGVSQTHELKSLSDLNITSLDVEAEKLPLREDRINQVLYKSRYFGAGHCQKGCASYDIFFGTSSTTYQASKN